MPVSLYDALRSDFRENAVLAEAVTRSHYASCLTHRHPRSQMACAIYTAVCHELIYRDGRSIAEALQSAMDLIMDYYSKADVTAPWYDQGFQNELAFDTYGRLRDIASFGKLPDREIKSGGYVVHTLEAAIWCLLNTASFAECTLKAVNLGDDTDTVGAVAGGLAGLAYGYESIPKEWLEVIAKREWIDGLCVDLSDLINA